MTEMIRSRSPQCPGDVVAERAAVSPDEVRALAARSRTAQAGWCREGPAGRASALRAAADRLRERADAVADLIVREVGKPAGEARAEVDRGAAILDYYAQACYAEGANLVYLTGRDLPGMLGGTVKKLRELSPLYDMHKEGIDLTKVQWTAH